MNPPLPKSRLVVQRDQWARRHEDCTRDTGFVALDEALYVRTAHSGHGPQCLQSLGAAAYLGGRAGDDYE